MGNRVQRVGTPISESQMTQAVIEAWEQLFGNTPTKQQVGLVMAQNSLETGHRKSMWNYNVGNITTDGTGVYDYFDDLTTSEQIKPGVWKKMNLKYRSYPTLMEGVKDYLRFISGKRYSKAWQNIMDPDPVAFSKALKESGYYTANEAPYTKNIVQLYSKFNNSNIYEKARSGKVESIPNHPEEKDDFVQKYQNSFNDNNADIYQELAGKYPISHNTTSPVDMNLDTVLENYLRMIAASEKTYKKLYKKFLPLNHAVIKIESINYTDAVEFARILCATLDEELISKSFIHTNGHEVDVECAIHGPTEDCFEAINQLSNVVSDTFKQATKKIGGVQVKTCLFINKKSSYQPITLTAAEIQHRKFLFKFI